MLGSEAVSRVPRIISRNCAIISSASASGRPLTLTVMRLLEALEMAQPWPRKRMSPDDPVLHHHLQDDVVPAQGVEPVRVVGAGLQVPVVAGLLVVLDDHLLVELPGIAHWKISWTFRMPETRASMSSRVVK